MNEKEYKCDTHQTNEGFIDDDGKWQCWICYKSNLFSNPVGRIVDEVEQGLCTLRIVDATTTLSQIRVELFYKNKLKVLNTHRDLSLGFNKFFEYVAYPNEWSETVLSSKYTIDANGQRIRDQRRIGRVTIRDIRPHSDQTFDGTVHNMGINSVITRLNVSNYSSVLDMIFSCNTVLETVSSQPMLDMLTEAFVGLVPFVRSAVRDATIENSVIMGPVVNCVLHNCIVMFSNVTRCTLEDSILIGCALHGGTIYPLNNNGRNESIIVTYITNDTFADGHVNIHRVEEGNTISFTLTGSPTTISDIQSASLLI